VLRRGIVVVGRMGPAVDRDPQEVESDYKLFPSAGGRRPAASRTSQSELTDQLPPTTTTEPAHLSQPAGRELPIIGRTAVENHPAPRTAPHR